MSRRILLIPVGSDAGLTTVSLGLVRAIEQQNVNVNFFKPVAQLRNKQQCIEKSTQIIRNATSIEPVTPLTSDYVEQMISDDKLDIVLEEIIGKFEQQQNDAPITVIEGLVTTEKHTYAVRLNKEICNALDAKVVFVCAQKDRSIRQLSEQLEIIADSYGGHTGGKLLGCIINKINAPVDKTGRIRTDITDYVNEQEIADQVNALTKMRIFSKGFRYLGGITWNSDLVAPRAIDLVNHLGASVINEGDLVHRRLRSVSFCAREIHNMVHALKPGALLVMSGDRSDVIVSACLAAISGTKIGAILLTGGLEPSPDIMALCQQALDTGLPIILTAENTWNTSLSLTSFNLEVPTDDKQRIDRVMEHTAGCIDNSWVKSLSDVAIQARKLSPPAFRYKLTKLARKANKTVVLPEGEEPRTIKAAAICARRKIAKCILLGNESEILRIAAQQGVEIGEGVEIIDPQSIRDDYVQPMLALRKHKGLTQVVAKEALMDNVVLGTMMLKQNDVSGLVSGAVHTTANTIRPALQLIKTAPQSSLVSSIFFMLLPEQVLVYGDCAINPDPNAEQLADIAIQSADSAATFGIEPRVAMISYSTGDSGIGKDVEKVKKATQIARQKRPDLMIDGPLQYDAAIMESVARKKAPNSQVAGRATVFVFPDLNTGNTTYKAVQRTADLVSIGPMLQGMGKPVNDLSRGALVDDIVYTIALTAIQASL